VKRNFRQFINTITKAVKTKRYIIQAMAAYFCRNRAAEALKLHQLRSVLATFMIYLSR